MARDAHDPVEVWAPLFLRYFKPEQITKPEFAVFDGNYCKLGDCRFTGRADKHMKEHAKELKTFLARKNKDAEKSRMDGLALYRAEQKAIREMEDDD